MKIENIDFIEQFVLGSLLGDGCVDNRYSFRLVHGDSQMDYLKWKVDFLHKNNLGTGDIYTYKIKVFGKEYNSNRYFVYNTLYFKPYRKLFYSKGFKEVSRKILNKLTPFALSIWYMDDGNLCIHRHTNKNGEMSISSRELHINTQSFSFNEHKIIQRYFKIVWGLAVRINKNKNKFRIVMNATNANKFLDIIKPYILPSMHYKIDMQYKNN